MERLICCLELKTWFDDNILFVLIIAYKSDNPSIQMISACSNISYCEVAHFISFSPKLITL